MWECLYVWGEDIRDAVKRMIALAKQKKSIVKMNFNGIELTTDSNGSVDAIVTSYHEKLKRRADKD